jgi:uncharacterized membrane protein YfcA
MARDLAMLALGAGAGVLAGLFGVGGGIVIIPMLILLFNFTQHRAQGTSLAAMLLPVGIFAAMRYYRDGNLDVRAGIFIGLGIIGGAYLGAVLAGNLPDWEMKKLFAIFLLLVSIKLLLEK